MKYLKAILLLAGFIVITSCISHKQPPSIIYADNYTAETLNTQQLISPSKKTLTLNEAISTALANNPTYKQKQLAIKAAWAQVYAQMGNYSPQLSTSTGAGTNTPKKNLAASWNVFNALQTTMNVLAARKTALSTEELNRNYRRELIYLTTTTYNEILLDRAQVQIDLSNEAYNEQMLRDTQLRASTGDRSQADVLNFKINKINAQNTAIKNRTKYKTNRYVLATLMGLTTADLPKDTQFPPVKAAVAPLPLRKVESYLDLAISQRPDLKSTKLNIESSKYKLYSKYGALFPTADLFINYGSSTNMPPNLNAGWAPSHPGTRIIDIRKAQINLDIQEEILANKWINVVKEVKDAHTKVQTNIARKEILKKALKIAQERRNLVREEYNAGNADITMLNQAQDNLVHAESKHISGTIDLSNSKAELNKACGLNVLD